MLSKRIKVQNAIITLGNTDDSGKGRHFKSRFIQPGLAGYPGQFGNALIKKENIDKFVWTLRGKPIIINHKDKIEDKDKVGIVNNVWFNPDDGWYWCDGIIFDDEAINLINNGWSVSCAYDFTKADNSGGTENNIPYDIEFLDGEFNHLALVDNPRYEGANIVFNSKVENEDKKEDIEWITVKGNHIPVKKGQSKEKAIKDFIESKQEKNSSTDKTKRREVEYKGAKIDINPDGKYADIKIYAPKGKTFGNGDTFYTTQKLTDEAEEKAKEIIEGEGKQQGWFDKKDLYSDENFKFNAKRLNEQFGEKPYSQWHKDVQTMLKKYGKTEEDFDNAIGAKEHFKKKEQAQNSLTDTILNAIAELIIGE